MSREPVIEVSDYPNVVERVNSLGLQIPTTIALLPRNFHNVNDKDELIQESEVATVRKLFRKAQILETPIELPEDRYPQIAEYAYMDWIAPILFFSFSALTQDPNLLNLSLGVIANYLTDLFKGAAAQRGVKLNLVIEDKNGSYKRVHYEGPLEGMPDVVKIVEKVIQDE